MPELYETERPMHQSPLLAVTMGDPAGIGPEIIVKAAASDVVRAHARLLVVGDPATLERAAQAVGSAIDVTAVSRPFEAGSARGIAVLPVAGSGPAIAFGKVDAQGGRAAYECLRHSIAIAVAGEVDGIVTAPLNKEALNLAGLRYAGHTEILKDLTHSPEVAMLLWSDRLKIIHVTGHMSLRQALDAVSPERVIRTATLGAEALRRLGIARPRIAIVGLNPHAGENRLFGDEDADRIAPAVTALAAQGFEVSGPHPPDTVFTRAYRGAFDLVVAMYHDQGHIPMKLVAFDSAVNVTVGLPIVRTSPDHGTAFDIAGTGRADPSSMIEAIRLASLLANREKASSATLAPAS
jgi:4-hydroxythreonine-4-phosphate dehydrogenase